MFGSCLAIFWLCFGFLWFLWCNYLKSLHFYLYRHWEPSVTNVQWKTGHSCRPLVLFYSNLVLGLWMDLDLDLLINLNLHINLQMDLEQISSLSIGLNSLISAQGGCLTSRRCLAGGMLGFGPFNMSQILFLMVPDHQDPDPDQPGLTYPIAYLRFYSTSYSIIDHIWFKIKMHSHNQ